MREHELNKDQIMILKQVSFRLKKGDSASEIFNQYGIDLKTFYKWQKSYDKMKGIKRKNAKSKIEVYDPRSSTLKIKEYYTSEIKEKKQLKNIHFNAWCFYWDKYRSSGKEESDIFKEFIEITQREAYILSDRWMENSVSHDEGYDDRFLKIITNALKMDNLDSIDLKGFHFVADGGVKVIIQSLVDVIDSDQASQKQKDNIYSFLKRLKETLIHRGKVSWDSIGHFKYFDWPDSDTLGDQIKLISKDFDWEKEGLLKGFGYHVGVSSSLNVYKRRRILDSLYQGNLKQYKFNLEEEWGGACSSERLRRITHSIAYFARSKKNIPKDYRQAIGEWKEDLKYLHDKYYVGFFDFDYPHA